MADETVTVEFAIKKGRKQLLYIPTIILFATVLICAAGIYFIENGSSWIVVCGVSSFVCPILLSFLYYFIMLPRWRIWAFSSVRNVHELKDTAIAARIYPNDGSFWWHFEIKNASQKEKIKDLESKFDQPDIYIDETDTALETKYSYSRVLNFLFILFNVVYFAGCIYLYIGGDRLISLMGLLVCVYLVWVTYKRCKQKGPALIISDNGIAVSNDGLVSKEEGFYSWKDVTNERVYWKGAGYVLAFDVYGLSKELDLTELTGQSSYKINHALRTHRGRYEASLKK